MIVETHIDTATDQLSLRPAKSHFAGQTELLQVMQPPKSLAASTSCSFELGSQGVRTCETDNARGFQYPASRQSPDDMRVRATLVPRVGWTDDVSVTSARGSSVSDSSTSRKRSRSHSVERLYRGRQRRHRFDHDHHDYQAHRDRDRDRRRQRESSRDRVCDGSHVRWFEEHGSELPRSTFADVGSTREDSPEEGEIRD